MMSCDDPGLDGIDWSGDRGRACARLALSREDIEQALACARKPGAGASQGAFPCGRGKAKFSGATGGFWRAFTMRRWAGCAARSNRFPRSIFTVFCAAGSTWLPAASCMARMDAADHPPVTGLRDSASVPGSRRSSRAASPNTIPRIWMSCAFRARSCGAVCPASRDGRRRRDAGFGPRASRPISFFLREA